MSDTDTLRLVERLASRTIALNYRDWNWGEGVAQYALLEAGTLLQRRDWTAEVSGFVHANAEVRPSRIDHIIPALPALLLYERTGDKLGLDLALRVAGMLETFPRSRHGAYQATPVRNAWVDYWYESAPLLCHLTRLTGESRYRSWAVDQSLAYLMACWNGKAGLFHHVYYDSIGAGNPFFWARANGWAALAITEMLDMLPAEYGLAPMLERVLRQLADTLAGCQNASGHWHTVLLDPTTYQEASTSSMVSLALRRAVRRGWLDKSYTSVADRAWEAVLADMDDEGSVLNVSGETPPGDAEYYQQIPLGVYPWGQGFTLLAALDRLER